jgi:hypothetical protein
VLCGVSRVTAVLRSHGARVSPLTNTLTSPVVTRAFQAITDAYKSQGVWVGTNRAARRNAVFGRGVPGVEGRSHDKRDPKHRSQREYNPVRDKARAERAWIARANYVRRTYALGEMHPELQASVANATALEREALDFDSPEVTWEANGDA